MGTINTDQPVYMQVAERVGQYPQGVGRRQIALDFNITYSTAVEHLERAWGKGLIRKFYGWITDTARGWLYAPIDQPPLPGWELIPGAEDDDEPGGAEERHAEDMRAYYDEQSGNTPPYAPDQDRRFPDDPAVYHYDGY
jgi:hypothetical protein